MANGGDHYHNNSILRPLGGKGRRERNTLYYYSQFRFYDLLSVGVLYLVFFPRKKRFRSERGNVRNSRGNNYSKGHFGAITGYSSGSITAGDLPLLVRISLAGTVMSAFALRTGKKPFQRSDPVSPRLHCFSSASHFSCPGFLLRR